jgi:hypothetical protein
MFEEAVNDPTLWQGYEEWLDTQEAEKAELDRQADYFFHLVVVGES